MFSFHKEFAKVKRPDTEELIVRSSNTESFIHSNRLNCGLIRSVSRFKLLCFVIYLENHTVSWAHIHSFKWFIFSRDCVHDSTIISLSFRTVWTSSLTSPFEIQTGKNGVACVLVQHNSRSSNNSFSFHSPEADILFTARDESRVIDRWEPQRQYIVFESVFSMDFRFLAFMDFGYVPNNQEFFVVLDCFAYFGTWLTDSGEVLPIGGES